jgi:hypothetical protein
MLCSITGGWAVSYGWTPEDIFRIRRVVSSEMYRCNKNSAALGRPAMLAFQAPLEVFPRDHDVLPEVEIPADGPSPPEDTPFGVSASCLLSKGVHHQ